MSDFSRIGPTGEFPEGKIDPSDDGELTMGIAYDPAVRMVRIEFRAPVVWFALTPAQARALAAMLLEKASKAITN